MLRFFMDMCCVGCEVMDTICLLDGIKDRSEELVVLG